MLSKLTLDPLPPQKKIPPTLKTLDFHSKHCNLISMPICIFSKFMIFCTNVLIYTPYPYMYSKLTIDPRPPQISIYSFNLIIIPVSLFSKSMTFYINVLIYTSYPYIYSKMPIDPLSPQKNLPPPLKSLDFPSKHCILISMPICIVSKFMIFCTNVLI